MLIDPAERFGPKSVATDPGAIEPWLTDWRGRFHGSRAAILAPGSTDEVAAMVALAAEHRVPLVPQGGNTSMVGGATPPADGSALILSLRRMDRLRSISAEDGLAVAEAGMILANLHARADEVGMRFPLTLGARGSCTIGGLIATNAGGTQVLRFGTMRALVAGVEAVLPDGSIHDGLGALKKDNRGYSIDQLLVGSEGTLGIITAASLRLVPAITGRAVAWLALDDPQSALDVLRMLAGADRRDRRVRDRPRRLARAGPGAYSGNAHAARRAASLARADRSDGVERSRRAPGALLERLLAPALGKGPDRGRGDRARARRRPTPSGGSAIPSRKPSAPAAPPTQHDISVPVADMPRFMVEAAREVEATFPGAQACASAISATAMSISTSGRKPRAPDWYEREAPAVTRFVARPRHRRRRLDLGRARHRPDEARRA